MSEELCDGNIGAIPRYMLDRIKTLEAENKAYAKQYQGYEDTICDHLTKIKTLEAGLKKIANQDYRGNRSDESVIAYQTLKEAQK